MAHPFAVISIDPKGQNAAVTARWRRSVSDVVMLNPLNVLDLGSAGFTDLAKNGIDFATLKQMRPANGRR